ncbi:MAG: hypothetical protein J6W52_04875 [Bacteroidaceae bacterium]|nr:hypothetical protein [Bacteroidaceae bacterium]
MKRKLFQILLMATITVSLGMFVSCKDTNGDWYNELKAQIDGKTTLQEILDKNYVDMTTLQSLLNQLQNEIEGKIPDPCTCTDWTDAINALNAFMKETQDALQGAEIGDVQLNNMKDLIDYIKNNVTTINNYYTYTGITMTQLDSAMAVLRNEISAINPGSGCECDLSRVDSLEKQMIRVFNWINSATTRLESIEGILPAVRDSLKQAAEAAKNASTAAQAAGDSAAAALELARNLETIANRADTLSKANWEKIQTITNQITNIDNRFIYISDSLKAIYQIADSAFVMIDANKQAIEKLDTLVNQNKAAIDDLNNITIPGLEGKIDSLVQVTDSLGTEIENLKPEITKLYLYADANLEKAKQYTDLEIALVRADLNAINIDIEALRQELRDSVAALSLEDFNIREDLKDSVAAIRDDMKEFKDSLINALTRIAELESTDRWIKDSIGKLDNRITENTLMIGQVKDTLDSVANIFRAEIDTLRSDLSNLAERVKKNEDNIEQLFGAIDTLKESLKRLVTGIIVQGTYNPAYGTFNLPAGVQSNVLLTYFGEAKGDIYFPTASTANYVDEKHVLTSKDMQMIGGESEPIFKGGDYILQNEEHNAGRLFLTVNPNTVDFTKLQLSLVNSQDQESYIKLGELKRSYETLQLGFSRAADNGFYECNANLAADDIKKVQKINFNTDKIKDAIREIVNKRTSASLTKIANDMVDVIKGLRIDANAVKCEWEDADAAKTKHAVYSNYNLAATAVKPLSLTTLKDADYKTVPGYERVMAFLDSLSSTAHSKVHVVFKELNSSALVKKVVNLQIKDISVPDLTDDLLEEFVLHMDTTFVMDGLSYTLDLHETVNVPVKFSQDVTVPIEIDQEVAIDLSNVLVQTPTIVVETDVKTGDGKATLVVPVKDNGGTTIGNAYVDLDDIDVHADASIQGGTITLDGQAVAHIEYKKDQTVKVSVDQTFPATFDFTKTLYFGDNGTDQKTFNLVFKYDMRKSAIDLWGVAQDALGDINSGLLTDIRDIISEVNNALDKINSYEDKINGQIDKYMDKVVDYIDKINTKMVNFVNSINSRLQPVLIASDGTGAKMLSEAKSQPTILGKKLTLVPTTWTIELAVPIAKKHVAVTNVFNGNASAQKGDPQCVQALQNANASDETMNTVLSGEQRRAFVNFTPGFTYEVAYSALDFHGKMTTRKYYILVKK